MPGGRPRKPVEAKILAGTFRPDRDGSSSGLVAGGSPVAPNWLAGEALAFWGQVVPGLVERRVAAACDAPVLAMMCWWYAQVRSIQEEIAKPGVVAGLYVQAGICWDKFEKLAAKFGLNPSDRAKLRVDPGAAPRGVASRKRG